MYFNKRIHLFLSRFTKYLKKTTQVNACCLKDEGKEQQVMKSGMREYVHKKNLTHRKKYKTKRCLKEK